MVENSALIIAGSDAHGVSCAVQSAKNLENQKYVTEIFSRFPDTGNNFHFWNETINNIKINDFNFILILDIPFDRNNISENLKKLEYLSKDVNLLYIDHHKTLDSNTFPDFIKIVNRAFYCCWGEPSYIMRIGAICDRDEHELPVKPDELEIAAGLDVSVRKNIEESIYKLSKEEYEYFQIMANEIPYPDKLQIHSSVLVATMNNIHPGWKFKSLEKAIQKNNLPYGIGLIEKDSEYEFVIIKDWQKKDLLSVEKLLFQKGIPGSSAGLNNYYGHENAMVFKVKDKNINLKTFIRALNYAEEE